MAIKFHVKVSSITHIVPLATVIFKLLSTWLGFDLDPYVLKACSTETAFCCRAHCVPPSSIVATVCSLLLEIWKIIVKKCLAKMWWEIFIGLRSSLFLVLLSYHHLCVSGHARRHSYVNHITLKCDATLTQFLVTSFNFIFL